MNRLEINATKFKIKLNQIFPNKQKRPFVSVIITAAGNGTRMGNIAKQLLPIHGIPCIEYSIQAFEKCDSVDEIIITSKQELIPAIQEICQQKSFRKVKKIVCGADTRQNSVLQGFLQVHKKSQIVCIHDAARPLIKTEHICELIETANRFGASCTAYKITDTVKEANDKMTITRTVPRDHLYAVQTPQVFKTDLYRISVAYAVKDGFTATDDCALAEHAGFNVKLCENPSHNIKLTTPQDISIISKLLEDHSNG